MFTTGRKTAGNNRPSLAFLEARRLRPELKLASIVANNADVAFVEAGRRVSVPAVITTHDEIGELARAFNRMVVELRDRERIKETFGKFIDPRIVAGLIGAGDALPRRPSARW